jgi:hypothetical protein
MVESPAFQPPPQYYPGGPSPTAAPQRFAGGQLPPVGPLLSETLSAFTRELGPYALAGLGQLVVLLPIVMGVSIFAYVIAIVLAIGAAAGSTAISHGGSDQGAALFSVGMIAAMTLLVLGMVFLMNVLLAPVFGSLYRAVARHQRGEQELSFGAPFSSLGTRLGSGIVVMSSVSVLVLLGALACYFPALLVAMLCSLAFPLVALHGLRPFAALGRSFAHVRQNFKWHLGYFGYSLLVNLVANYVPVVGPMFVLAFQVRVYREVFGDGDEPNFG